MSKILALSCHICFIQSLIIKWRMSNDMFKIYDSLVIFIHLVYVFLHNKFYECNKHSVGIHSIFNPTLQKYDTKMFWLGIRISWLVWKKMLSLCYLKSWYSLHPDENKIFGTNDVGDRVWNINTCQKQYFMLTFLYWIHLTVSCN